MPVFEVKHEVEMSITHHVEAATADEANAIAIELSVERTRQLEMLHKDLGFGLSMTIGCRQSKSRTEVRGATMRHAHREALLPRDEWVAKFAGEVQSLRDVWHAGKVLFDRSDAFNSAANVGNETPS